VKAGQRLVVNLPKKETVITEEDDGGRGLARLPVDGYRGPGRSPRRLSAPPVAGRPTDRNPTLATERRAVDAKSGLGRGWVEAVAAGRWDRVLAEVDRAGVKQTLAHASSEDLLALADAARYRRRTGLARAALLAERDRFPGSPSALDAAFLLGRLEESRQGEIGEAVRWYDTYLAGAPAGTYASEALGRKMHGNQATPWGLCGRIPGQGVPTTFPCRPLCRRCTRTAASSVNVPRRAGWQSAFPHGGAVLDGRRVGGECDSGAATESVTCHSRGHRTRAR
jgi:hypothetical protein